MKVLAVLMRIEKLDHAWKWFINKPYVDSVEALGWSLYPIWHGGNRECAAGMRCAFTARRL